MLESRFLDFSALLAPISEESPVGINLREDVSHNSLYYQIKDARSAARIIERERMQGNDAHKADKDWDVVYQLATKILTSHTKDLEIITWLIEASLRKYGFAGLAESFRLAYAMVDKYWDQLYPEPDDEGLFTKVAPFVMLNGVEMEGSLIVPIFAISITEGQDQGPFASWEYQQALESTQIVDEEQREKRIVDGFLTLAELELAASQTSAEFFHQCYNDLQQCLDDFALLSAKMDEKCGAVDAPPSSRIREALTTCQNYLKNLAKDILIPLMPEESIDTSTPVSNAENSTISGNIESREQAFRALLTIVNYFKKTEPQSVVPYLLEKAVRWGRLSWPALLAELIEDNTTREILFRLTDLDHE